MIKVVAYCRVSTGSEEQATSLHNQTIYFQEKCQNNENYELMRVYSDKGVSDNKLDRPQFNKMLYDAGIDIEYLSNGEAGLILSDREPEFELILIKDTSRLARNLLAVGVINKLREKNVFIEFSNINLNTKDPTSDLTLKMLMVFDEEESRAKGEKVQFGHRRGMELDLPVIPGISYGYDKIDRQHLKINEEQAEVVRFIFEAYVKQKIGTRAIANACNDRGYKSKRGGKFNVSSITLILKNPIYKGTLIRGKHDFSTFGGRKIDMTKCNKDYFITDNHQGIPVIISSELWEKAQTIMESRINNTRGVKKSASKYGGILMCEKCGSPYHKNTDRGRVYYVCGKKRVHGSSTCDARNISEEKLDRLIFQYAETKYKERVVKRINSVVLKLRFLKHRIGAKARKEVDNRELVNVMKQLEEQKKRKSSLISLVSEELCDMDEIKEELGKLKVKNENLKLMLNELNKTADERKKDIDAIEATIEQLESIELKDTYTVEEIMSDIHHIVVGEITDGDKKIVSIKPIFKVMQLINELSCNLSYMEIFTGDEFKDHSLGLDKEYF